MTNPAADLLTFRAAVAAHTGLGASDVGIVGDGAHQRTGGYHEGAGVLRAIGRYHGPAGANVGASGEDYSARLRRDRAGLTEDASGVDIGDAWPRGGRAAWLRYNNMLLDDLRNHPERVPALRAINVSRDGVERKRFDREHAGDGLINSVDLVNIHTHHEYYRDTAGTPARAQTLTRQLALIAAAINGAITAGDDMALTDDGTYVDIMFRTLMLVNGGPQAGGPSKGQPNVLHGKLDGIVAAQAASAQREQDMLAVLHALAAGGSSVDTAAVLARIDQRSADVTGLIGQLQQANAALQHELDAVKAAAEANLSDVEKAALPKP